MSLANSFLGTEDERENRQRSERDKKLEDRFEQRVSKTREMRENERDTQKIEEGGP